MRQLAVFESAEQARTLAAYLVTQRIAAHAEAETSGHSVWVRDEDKMPSAKEALAHFRAHPSDPRYTNVESAASDVRRQQDAEHAARQKNVVEMRGRWKSGPGIKRKAPITMGLIVVSVLVSLAGNSLFKDQPPPNVVLDAARFVDSKERQSNFADVARGQLWRLVTPIFVHYGLIHLVFNSWVMYVLAGQVEDRRGSLYFMVFVLTSAVLSNVAQASVAEWLHELGLFGGMSGVGYAVFGYLWMKVKFDPGAGYQLDNLNIAIMLGWLILCIVAAFPPLDGVLTMLPRIANTAHVVGLFVGMGAALFPLPFRRR